jgi:hypothetical protein
MGNDQPLEWVFMNKNISLKTLFIIGIGASIIMIMFIFIPSSTSPIKLKDVCIVQQFDRTQCISNFRELLGKKVISVCGVAESKKDERVWYVIKDQEGVCLGDCDMFKTISPGPFCSDLELPELLTFKKYSIKIYDKREVIFTQEFEIK